MNGLTGDIPKEMIAIEITEAGGPDVLKAATRPVPTPTEGEVLVKVAAAGVNRPDVMQRAGQYPAPPDASDLPGLEIAGEIVAVGNGVDDIALGTKICALVEGGGYAEYCVARAGQCLPVPDSISMEEAAAMPETLLTVWHNLFERGYAVEGETALIHGGTSGIGTMAIKLCTLFGVTSIVTCGSDEKCAAAKKIGADHAINYKTSDFVEEVNSITGGNGANIVLDMVGGDYVPRNMKCMAMDARHVSIAIQGGMQAEINIIAIMMRRYSLTGSTLRSRSAEFKALLTDEIYRTVWPDVQAGKLKPEINKVFPLSDAAGAHAHMESGDHVGKIVLTV